MNASSTPNHSLENPASNAVPTASGSGRLALLLGGVGLVAVLALLFAGRLGVGPATEAFADAPHPLIGQPAPAFSVDTLDGGTFGVEAGGSGEVVVLDFWATWCPPCVAALPVLHETVEAAKDAGQPVRLVAMNFREDADTIDAFLEAHGLEAVAVGLDAEGAVMASYRAEFLPTTVVVNPAGVVSAVHVGFDPDLGEMLAADIAAALEP